MKLEPVTSSNIASIGYDHASRTLAVQFKSGGLYHYHGVSPKDHADFVSAKSHGQHFAANINGKFRHSKQ